MLLETYEPNPNDLEYIIPYDSSVPMQFIISIDFHENTLKKNIFPQAIFKVVIIVCFM